MALVDLNAGRPNRAMPLLLSLVEQSGAIPVVFDARRVGRLPRARHAAYVLTGGPGSPLDRSAWRDRVLSAIPAWCAQGPVLGICLGYQLIAAAHGWPLRLLPQPRFGVYEIRRTRAGMEDPLLSGLAPGATVFEQRRWAVHLPPRQHSAVEILALAHSGEVISARFGPRVAGTTFHPEAQPEAVEEWFSSDPAVREKVAARQRQDGLLRSQDAIPRLRSTWLTVIPSFLSRALPPAGA